MEHSIVSGDPDFNVPPLIMNTSSSVNSYSSFSIKCLRGFIEGTVSPSKMISCPEEAHFPGTRASIMPSTVAPSPEEDTKEYPADTVESEVNLRNRL